MQAIDPLVELLLEIGITSPEAESLLRSLFIHKAHAWLSRRADGGFPSDVRVALVTGVHRNFVRSILAEPPKIARTRERRGYLAGRLLGAWHTEAAYCDDSGKPRDLPEKGAAPSFAALVAAHLPGASAGVVLQELQRAGVVESLSEHRVRVRSRTMRQPGLNLENVASYGSQAKALLTTLTNKLLDPRSSAYFESSPSISIDGARIALIRDVVARRGRNFLLALEKELAGEARRGGRRAGATFAVSVIETEARPATRARRRREKGG
jgi:Family of unknown function (DUF6502)